MAIPTCDLWQTAYVLSMQANLARTEQGTPEHLAKVLSHRLNAFYARAQGALGPWSTVWGPAIFENKPSPQGYSANVMYVAANADRSLYVVSVAGANGDAKFDLLETLDVGKRLPWSQAFQGSPQPQGYKPFLSMGTVDGVNALLGLKDLRTGLTLMDFLKAAHRPQATLIFSGHSLGGALAPVLALVLFNPFGGPLKQADWRSVLNYPTAGPTPGNQQLAQFFASAFPMTPARPEADSYRVWNANIWITLDVIPHAWEISMLDEIPTLYKLSDELRLQVRAEIAIAKALSNEGAKAGGPYTMLPNQKVTRPYVDPILGDMQAFDAELLYQHISAYNILLNVESLISSPAAPSPISQAAKSGSPA